MPKMIKIKTCPFCGDPACNVATISKRYYVRCFGCGATSNTCISLEEAVINWNRRVDNVTEIEWRMQDD